MKTQRIRDPIHDLIIFDENDRIDQAAWALLNEPELQRLRRIRQLGVSEFVYPSATHTRLAHSIGVFHNARRLIKIIRREIDSKRVAGEFDEGRANVALMAALLHDIGHGPFSHAFEEARKSLALADGKAQQAKVRKHEAYTADMILNPKSNIRGILEGAHVSNEQVADMLKAENPTDMYHGVVSSSFDADRLDYLQRDRYMTGVGAGAIDLPWLMDNVRCAEIDVSIPGGNEASIYTLSFCLGYKARDAAEDFLLSRYRLYGNVYFHKVTRGFEQLISYFFRLVYETLQNGKAVKGLPDLHPILKFFGKDGDTIDNYLDLDDYCVLGALQQVALLGSDPEKTIANMILHRIRPYCFDVQKEFPQNMEDQRRIIHAIKEKYSEKLERSVFFDSAKLSIYGEIGADDSRAQKRLMIQMADRSLREITDFTDSTIQASDKQKHFDRFYFLEGRDCEEAKEMAQAMRRK